MTARVPDELDELTLARAQRGDDGAFRQLVERYQSRVHHLLYRLLDPSGRGALVDDLCQETFLRVFGALPRFVATGPARLSTWILTIATRLAIQELRRAPVASSATVAEPVAPERTDADLERRALGQALRRALAALDPDQRAVLLLRELDELDYEEIATILDVPVGTVRSRLSRARARLREVLAEERHG